MSHLTQHIRVYLAPGACVVIPLVAMVLVAAFFGKMPGQFLAQASARSFIPVMANILECEIETKRGPDSVYYAPRVQYEYTIEGAQYTSDQVRFLNTHFTEHPQAVHYVTQRLQHAPQIAYVDPADHSNSVLVREIHAFDWVVWYFAAITLLISVLIALAFHLNLSMSNHGNGQVELLGSIAVLRFPKSTRQLGYFGYFLLCTIIASAAALFFLNSKGSLVSYTLLHIVNVGVLVSSCLVAFVLNQRSDHPESLHIDFGNNQLFVQTTKANIQHTQEIPSPENIAIQHDAKSGEYSVHTGDMYGPPLFSSGNSHKVTAVFEAMKSILEGTRPEL